MNYLKSKGDYFKSQRGIGLPELVIVLLVISIILVIAIPQIMSSRRLMRFGGMQREIVTLLRETRQDAMSQRNPITFRFQNNQGNIIIYGGVFGALGSSENKVHQLEAMGLTRTDIIYGRPPSTPALPLDDGTNITMLTSDTLEITFQSDGSVVDASNNPQDNALFFYHREYSKETAFAVSVLGASGRIKIWRYDKGVNKYVE